MRRIRILDVSQREPFISARVQPVPDLNKPDVELDALVLNLLVRIDLLNQHIEKMEEARTQERKKIPERKA